MSSSPKIVPSLQAYRLMVYRRSLHPEFFRISDRRAVRSGEYELEAWLAPGAHMLRFQHGGQCVVEVVTPTDSMPEAGRLTAFPCAGERDHEERVGERVRYMTAVQTELTSDNIYRSTLQEMEDYADEMDAMRYRWTEPGSRLDNLSVVDMQRFHREVHAQTWHLDAAGGLVLRTQAIFEVTEPAEKKNGEVGDTRRG
ncbi:MAG: hypothetical protein ACF8PN_05695 [Phycisphaerales bacterium]